MTAAGSTTSGDAVLVSGVYADAGRRYRIIDLLGAGSFGVVYRVFDEVEKTELALKTIFQASPERRQWLKNEYRSLSQIYHPNLVSLRDLRVDEQHCFFTMALVERGEHFTKALAIDRKASDLKQAEAVRRFCHAAYQLCRALEKIHASGKCHRDVKPSNVLVTPENRVVLLDFGMVSPVEHDWLRDSSRNAVAGTLAYLAPEQYACPGPLPSSDWYSMGVVLYEALVGALPIDPGSAFDARRKGRLPPPPSSVAPAVPASLDRVVLGLLEPDPRKRMSPDEVRSLLRSESGGAEAEWEDPGSGHLFVGREGELKSLARAYEAAATGLTVSKVCGASGIGKTALVERFLQRLAAQPGQRPLVFSGRCDPHESVPYRAFDAVIDQLTHHWMRLEKDDQAAAMTLCPSEGRGALVRLFPVLGRVQMLSAHAADTAARGDPRAVRQSAFDALRVVLARLRQRSMLVIWIDDLQWADVDSAALIDRVFGAADAPAIHLILSHRPFTSHGGDSDRRPSAEDLVAAAIDRVRRAQHEFGITLEALSPGSALELARSITKNADPAAAAAVPGILEESAGNPYLISELAHFAVRRGSETAGRASERSLLHDRLQSLSSEARTVLEVAALCGAPQERRVLLQAAGEGDPDRLDSLIKLRFLSPANDDKPGDAEGVKRYRVYHDRLAESVVASLTQDVRVRRHVALVRAMEECGVDDAEQLTAHAQGAGDRAAIRRHAQRAAQRAEEKLAFGQAARFYRILLESTEDGGPVARWHELIAEAFTNDGRSEEAAMEFERAVAAIAREDPADIERRGYLRRCAGEHYLKAGLYDKGVQLMQAFLRESNVELPAHGKAARALSMKRRAWLYLRGFQFKRRPVDQIPPMVRKRLNDLWASTTALSMMDPVSADSVGLLHFLESLRAGHGPHVARSYAYEAAFAALIGHEFFRAKARQLLGLCERILVDDDRAEEAKGPGAINREEWARHGRERDSNYCEGYERGLYKLTLGCSAFFHSQFLESARLCDEASEIFLHECKGARHDAEIATVFSFMALGLAGRVSELAARIPAAIVEAESRQDVFAAHNYRGGFHALARIAVGQIEEVRKDLKKVEESRQGARAVRDERGFRGEPGFYQMHAYHRVFAKVAADLYEDLPREAVSTIEADWPVLEAGQFLLMQLPAVELRCTRARAHLALAGSEEGSARKERIARVKTLIRQIKKQSVAAARPHAALLEAGIAATAGERDRIVPGLRAALDGYTRAGMAIHREVTRWLLAHRVAADERRALLIEAEHWMRAEGINAMAPLARTIAPGVDVDSQLSTAG